jgi:hypothetical protein
LANLPLFASRNGCDWGISPVFSGDYEWPKVCTFQDRQNETVLGKSQGNEQQNKTEGLPLTARDLRLVVATFWRSRWAA